jgi:UDP-4-amino-4-deoxy-L-arabinose-oxoglutarate aminotransferase
MQFSLQAMGIGPGDRVLTPSITWASTIKEIQSLGAIPVFCDVDRDTLMITADSIQSSPLSNRARLIIPTHFAGAAAEIDQINELARERNMRVIEDAAHALGTDYHARPIGSAGTVIISFHPIRDITKGGGGVICTDDENLADRIRRLQFRHQGTEINYHHLQGIVHRADSPEPYSSYNLADKYAAVGISQLRRLEQLKRQRKILAKLYLQKLDLIDEIRPLRQPPTTSSHSWHLCAMRLDIDKAGFSRDKFVADLDQAGISANPHFSPLHLRNPEQKKSMIAGYLPNTEWNAKRMFCLPLNAKMQYEDVIRVVESIKSVLHNNGCKINIPFEHARANHQQQQKSMIAQDRCSAFSKMSGYLNRLWNDTVKRVDSDE